MPTHLWNLIRHSTPWLKFAEFRHRYSYAKAYYRMKEGLERYQACQNKKPAGQIRKEMALSRNYWGCEPLFYYRHNLYRQDAILTEEEVLDYIPAFFFHRLLIAPYYDNKLRGIVDNKNVLAALYQGLAIPHPKTSGFISEGGTYDADMLPLSPADLVTDLNQSGAERIFLKPSDGLGGQGITLFVRTGDGYRTPDGQPLDPEMIAQYAQEHNGIFQEGVQQHAALDQIYAGSVNTLRIITHKFDGQPRIIAALLRIGHSGAYIDNFSQDGIALGIDLETGQAYEKASLQTAEKITHHPDTNYVFKNFSVPNWPAVKAFVIQCCHQFNTFPHLGWDIALTDEGPLVIEQNIDIGPDLPQMALGGMRKAYRIDDPQRYWRMTGKERLALWEKYAL